MKTKPGLPENYYITCTKKMCENGLDEACSKNVETNKMATSLRELLALLPEDPAIAPCNS